MADAGIPKTEMVAQLDTNGDGNISATEILQSFRRIDTDGDGKISKEELLAEFPTMNPAAADKLLQKYGELSGGITQKEYGTAVHNAKSKMEEMSGGAQAASIGVMAVAGGVFAALWLGLEAVQLGMEGDKCGPCILNGRCDGLDGRLSIVGKHECGSGYAQIAGASKFCFLSTCACALMTACILLIAAIPALDQTAEEEDEASAFSAFDADGDGVVDENEMRAGLIRQHGNALSEADIDEILKEAFH